MNTKTLRLLAFVSVPFVSVPLAFVPLVLAARAPAAELAWESSLDKALESAKSARRVVFLAVNMDGEGASDRLAKNVYTDKDIVQLSTSTVNLVASAAEHAGGEKGCPRFHGLSCAQHRTVEQAARERVLKPDPGGNIVAPQHVFLDPEGKPLLSVPYEITAGELAWCFVTAIKKADPSSKLAMPSSARMPRQVVIGAVYDPSGFVGGAILPVTKPELAGLIKQVKKGLGFEERQAIFWRILHSDLPEALEFIRSELRSGEAPSGRDAGGDPGGGPPRGGGGGEKHLRLLHAMGAVSPPVYWELAAEFLSDADEKARAEAAVALEQMVAPQAVKALEKALAKEKKPDVEKDLVRALAACGGADPKVRAAILKRARTEKDELLRINSIVALGLVDADPDITAFLKEIVHGKDDRPRVAAVCAAALTRDESWIAELEPLAGTAQGVAWTDALTRALEVLKGGPMKRLQMPVWTVCKDTIPREKTFGKSDG
jgi:hypothetical protein